MGALFINAVYFVDIPIMSAYMIMVAFIFVMINFIVDITYYFIDPRIRLKEENGSTILSYEVNVNIGGKVAQLGSRLIDGVAKKMSDYFFGRFSDLVSPIKKEEIDTGDIVEEKRVVELKSNFLNKYFYFALATLILLLVVIFYFVSR